MLTFSLRDERGFNQGFAPVGSTPTRMLRRNEWFVGQVAAVGARRVLELGCGTGETAAHIAARTGADVVALDISPMFVAHARAAHRHPNLRFETFDLGRDDVADLGTFDLCVGNGILHHLVAQLPAVLRQLRALTSAGGGFAFIEPNLLNPYCAFIFGTKVGRRFAHLEPGEMAFAPATLQRTLPAAGWSEVEVATRDFLLPGLPTWAIAPVLGVEPILEWGRPTRWLAQSHFITARAEPGERRHAG